MYVCARLSSFWLKRFSCGSQYCSNVEKGVWDITWLKKKAEGKENWKWFPLKKAFDVIDTLWAKYEQ